MPLVFTAKSYSCGPLGRVRRLLDLDPGIPAGANWTDVDVPQAAPITGVSTTLWDIETSENDGNHVFVVGECDNGIGPILPFYGVAVSTNGGTNWFIPGGNYINAPMTNLGDGHPFQWNEIVVIGPQVYGVSGESYIVGSALVPTHGLAAIAKSTDGGATYNLIGASPGVGNWNLLLPLAQQGNTNILNLDAWSLHFDGQVGVVGLVNMILKTTDGGASWLILNNGTPLTDQLSNPLTPGNITGIRITADQTGITAVGNGMVVSAQNFSPPYAGVAQDSWWDASSFMAPPYAPGIGWHIPDSRFPNDSLLQVTGDNNMHATGNTGSLVWSGSGCNCGIPGVNRRAAHNLSPLLLVGQYASLYNMNNQVWFSNNWVADVVGNLFDQASEGLDYVPTAVWTWYEEHEEPEEFCYRLESCSNPGTYVNTNQNFSGYVGQVVTLNEPQYPGCWTVLGVTPCDGSEIFLSVNLTFANCRACQPTPCYYLQDCLNPLIQYFTSTDLSFYFTQNLVVTVAEYQGCFQVFQSPDCIGLTPPVTVLTSTADCQSCPAHCYRLVDCLGTAPDIITNVDLSLQVGNVIQIANSPVCWQVQDNLDDCTGAVNVTVVGNFIDCTACLPVCYLLTNCVDPFNTIITNNNLAPYVGQVIKIDGYTECWQVSIAPNCTGSVPVGVTNLYNTCLECLPAPPPPVPTPVDLNPRRVKPGYYTPGCNPDYTEKVNCNFADQVYNQMLVPRYGISVCCEEDVNKWDIKKQLLEFSAIYDPSLCKCTLQTCCPPTCVDAFIQQFNPQPACIPPDNVTADIVQPPPLCTATCYQLTAGQSGPCDVDYVDCFGVAQVQTVGGTEYICSITVPVPVCSDMVVSSTPFNCSAGTCGP